MSLPVVAIVGRPNVGKSSLFNMLARERVSIVAPMPGVTRDRISRICEIGGRYLELVDTGGVGIVDRDDLSDHVERQIRFAIDRANLVLFVVDGREGLNPLDHRTADLLRRLHDRVLLIANKVDEPHMAAAVTGEFIRLGYGEPLCLSALNGSGRAEFEEILLDRLEKMATAAADEAPGTPTMKLAIVGRRNTGKSTFVNSLAGEERVIVSEVPGTTRDSVDVIIEREGRSLTVIDTAGVRKKARIFDDVEFYGYSRAVASIDRADLVLFFIDATAPIGQVDKKLGHLILDRHKPVVLVINKWDLAKGRMGTEEYADYFDKVMPGLDFAPMSFVTAQDTRNVLSTVDLAASLYKQARRRMGTGRLNQVLRDAMVRNPPKAKKGTRMPKLLYATQVATAPPTIVLFVDRPANVTPSYERFILNRVRESLPIDEVPIRLVFRARRRPALTGDVTEADLIPDDPILGGAFEAEEHGSKGRPRGRTLEPLEIEAADEDWDDDPGAGPEDDLTDLEEDMEDSGEGDPWSTEARSSHAD